MPKVKECCCGCSLRTGSLILLWIALVGSSIFILISLMVFQDTYNVSYRYEKNTFAFQQIVYNFILSIIVFVVSILGIYGIHKNIPKYLGGILYYFCYRLIHAGVRLVVLIFFRSSYGKFFTFIPFLRYQDHVLVLVVLAMFEIALTSYFTLVLKSCRDSMRTKNKDNGFADFPDQIL